MSTPKTQKQRESAKRWQKAHPERVREMHRLWVARNKKERAEYMKSWSLANSERRKKERKIYQDVNSEKIKQTRSIYREKNREKISATNKKWRVLNKDWTKERIKNNPNFRIARLLRRRLYNAVKCKKAGSAVDDCGCTVDVLRLHLEKQFKEGMSWSNYGEWHVDHIKPLGLFDLSDREQFLEACHYTNLRPLWKLDNLCRPKDGSDLIN